MSAITHSHIQNCCRKELVTISEKSAVNIKFLVAVKNCKLLLFILAINLYLMILFTNHYFILVYYQGIICIKKNLTPSSKCFIVHVETPHKFVLILFFLFTSAILSLKSFFLNCKCSSSTSYQLICLSVYLSVPKLEFIF